MADLEVDVREPNYIEINGDRFYRIKRDKLDVQLILRRNPDGTTRLPYSAEVTFNTTSQTADSHKASSRRECYGFDFESIDGVFDKLKRASLGIGVLLSPDNRPSSTETDIAGRVITCLNTLEDFAREWYSEVNNPGK